MNPVPSYQIIEFLEWLNSQREYSINEEFNREELSELALSFLEEKQQQSVFDRPRRSSFQSAERDTEPIDFNMLSINAEAYRLANSLKMLIDGRFDSAIASNHELAQRLMKALGGTSTDIVQSLEFLKWLERNYPKLNIAGSIPSEKTTELVHLFCEQVGYSNGVSFSRQVRNWLRGEELSSRLLRRLNIFLSRSRNKDYINTGRKTFNRYNTVKLHGIFLFLSSGDFPTFIEEHWEDLNYLTGNHIDIYYSQEDLKNRVSGHRILSSFKSLNIEVSSLPALVVWQDSLEDAKTITLDKLPHEEIVKALQHFVQAVKDGKAIEEVIKSSNFWIEQRLTELGIVVKQRGTIMVGEGSTYNDLKGANVLNFANEVKDNAGQQANQNRS
ncbi:hypothetical protein [uncultured Nostoc sp.]|uniref:hypothetical protein n=1 Tax=uncultured Nostoc sp. TaxID=340711 RepID=UPI00260D4E09|nr:hypothetical protein [uncultured Nostoc sp.]